MVREQYSVTICTEMVREQYSNVICIEIVLEQYSVVMCIESLSISIQMATNHSVSWYAIRSFEGHFLITRGR